MPLLQRPTDRDDDVDPDTLADSLSELPEARLVVVPGRSREVLASDDPPPKGRWCRRGALHAGLVYPEWDFRTNSYHEHGAVIRVRVPTLGDAAWADAVLSRRAALLHEVRRRFERLRPRRHRMGRQLDGPEVDLAAYVAAYADRRAGRPTDGRLYEAIRETCRDVAIALLVDVSGSSDSWIMHDLRVIDVEKEALLVVCDALDALGDPYTIQAFSGEGPECVSVLPIKTFEDRSGSTVRRRIAALEPDRYTRMGAALRHTTVLLMARPARHRLLLVLSDGKPNDVDRYEGRYGVEDAPGRGRGEAPGAPPLLCHGGPAGPCVHATDLRDRRVRRAAAPGAPAVGACRSSPQAGPGMISGGRTSRRRDHHGRRQSERVRAGHARPRPRVARARQATYTVLMLTNSRMP